MKSLIQLKHGISVVDAHYVQAGVACIYLIKQGNQASIIETGTSYSVPYILSALEALDVTLDNVKYIIPTHIHLDHAAGAGELMQQCPNAELVIHPRGAAHMVNPEKLEAGTIAVYGEEKYKKLYGSLIPIDENRMIIAEDNFTLDFNGRPLRFLHTPGHALHHFCIFDEMSQGIFTGDTFGLSYKTIKSDTDEFIFATTTPVHFDPEAMIESIDRLMSLKPKVMYLTHFAEIEPTETVVKQLKDSVHVFVEIARKHQAKKEGRVEAIEQDIINWLVAQVLAMNDQLNEKQIKSLLRGDSQLNAQGIEVWLKRQERN
ncbi:MAG: MBL fold metallo-hydrolase [Gammaproteobacteria bacterium]|nr:MBL fold metallo-hydrolase [Gammaproteobacteria bacterium]